MTAKGIDKCVLFFNSAFGLLQSKCERTAAALELAKSFFSFLIDPIQIEHISHLQAGDTGQNEGDTNDNVKQHAVNFLSGSGVFGHDRFHRL